MKSKEEEVNIGSGVPRVSFEFFPPATSEMERKLWSTVERLAPYSPEYVSVTYGAGGTTRHRTHETVARIANRTSLNAAAHLTCVGATREEITALAERYYALGVNRLVALRGDGVGGEAFQPTPGGYTRAAELVAGLMSVANFDISVACYPEKHPEAKTWKDDLDNLKAKVEAGARRAITQFFFDEAVFLRFRDKVSAAGINVPLIPGILPVTNYARTRSFAAACGAHIPDRVDRLFSDLDKDPETRRLVAASVAAEQCRRLREEGVDAFHFYTLNRAELTEALCRLLGLSPARGSLSPVKLRA